MLAILALDTTSKTSMSNSDTDKNKDKTAMNTDLREVYDISEDVLNASSIAYDFCKDAQEERVAKIRPILELIHKKADKLCVKLLELAEK